MNSFGLLRKFTLSLPKYITVSVIKDGISREIVEFDAAYVNEIFCDTKAKPAVQLSDNSWIYYNRLDIDDIIVHEITNQSNQGAQELPSVLFD